MLRIIEAYMVLFVVDKGNRTDIILLMRLGGVAERQVTIHFYLEAKS